MSPTLFARWARAAGVALAGAILALGSSPAQVEAQGALLEGGHSHLVLTGNDFQCILDNEAGTCHAASPTDPGGVWPKGSPNAYMFNSGLMIASIIGDNGGPWAGDTVGDFFFNASGGTVASPITNLWNSLDPEDIAAWPEAGDVSQFPFLSAYVTNPDLFSDVLLGREAASQQDSWAVYWDGDPGKTGGRPHPAGILVAQRTLAWNYPAGNEGTLYFVYEITNVSNNAYFQQLQEARFFGGANQLPDEGWILEDVYMSYAADPDVTANAGGNFATAILPFNMGIVYDGDFVASEFQYPPAIFHTPFFVNAPGIIGTKYLASPNDLGLTLFSVYINGGTFSDPSGSEQLYRYLSGTVDPALGDDPCTFTNAEERRVCYVEPAPRDVRYFQASGPFDMQPGETVTIVSAMFAAATVQNNPAGPTVTIGVQNPPPATEEPAATPSVHPGCFGDPITFIERASGWVTTEVCPATEGDPVDIFDVEVINESLLFKAQVAQTIFDNKFLLPFAPEPPTFYVVPGDDQVTVVWEPSPSEESGDPFGVVATDPTSPLYNPNFREDDVEGYRIYRSNDGITFTLIAQFDRTGTTFTDVKCETEDDYVPGDPCTSEHVYDLNGRLIQYPSGGIVELGDGSTLVVDADTAPPERFPALANTGVPYVFVDTNVRNGFEYHYQVTAFDINSLSSGPSSLESASLPAKQVVPAPLAAGFALDSVEVSGGLSIGGAIVSPDDMEMEINATTGTFTAAPPPTNAFPVTFQVFSPELLPSNVTLDLIRVDSVIPEYYGGTYYLTDLVNNRTVTVGNEDPSVGDSATASFTFLLGDEAKRDSLIDAGVDAPSGGIAVTVNYLNTQPHFHSADADWAPLVPGFWHLPVDGGATIGGSRWFSGANETMADPTVDYLHGELPGVTTIFQPMAYSGMAAATGACTTNSDLMRRFFQTTWAARRVADIEVRWGAAGVAEVFDVTHQVAVPFHEELQATYGFLDDATGNGLLSYEDFWYIPGLENTPNIGGCSTTNPTPLLQQPLVTNVDVDGDRVSDGQGFGLYIAGEPYLFLLSAGLPTSGAWTLRSYQGEVTGAPGDYTFTPAPIRTPGVPGLVVSLELGETQTFFAENVDLRDIRVAPDPYYGASLYDFGPSARSLRFLNLPPQASIRIYTVSGVLVDVLNHNDDLGGGMTTWDMRNRAGQMIASGVYFYHVTTPDGQEHIGRFTVINSGLAR